MILIYCQQNLWKTFEDYINSIKNHLNFKITFDLQEMEYKLINNEEDKLIFIKNIPNNILNQIKDKNNIYLINTEQMTKQIWRNYIFSLPENVKIIDYSDYNLSFYKNHFNSQLIEYQYNNNEILNLKKTKDVVFIGTTSNYRSEIINRIKKNNKIDQIFGWGLDRDKKLFQYKILVNISYNENYKIFESIRCYRCLFNKMIIISDIKDDSESIKYKDNIIFVKYDEIPNKVNEVLDNYQYYYDKLDLNNIENLVSSDKINLI